MAYDPTLTPKEQDEARTSGSVYTVEVQLKKTKVDRMKEIVSNISMDEDSVKAFYYGMKANLLHIVSGVVGILTLTLWEPNLAIRYITLNAKHSAIARQRRIKAEAERAARQQALVDAIKDESKEKEPELSDDEKMEDWLRKYKES